MVETILELQNISHRFGDVEVLSDISFKLHAGETMALTGPSGSGKTTLLQLCGLLDTPNIGEVHLLGQSTLALNEQARTLLRRHQIGFIYQFHHLLPEFNALENVLMPIRIAGRLSKAYETRASELLHEVGLSDRMTHRPAELSGGERQRVAIARALIHEPALILADEPTGNLDEAKADAVFSLFLTLAKEAGAAIIVATHNLSLASRLDHTARLYRGRLKMSPEPS